MKHFTLVICLAVAVTMSGCSAEADPGYVDIGAGIRKTMDNVSGVACYQSRVGLSCVRVAQ